MIRKFILVMFAAILVSASAQAGQLRNYLTQPVTASDPAITPDWHIAAQLAFDGYGGTNVPNAISHGWLRQGTPSAAVPFVCIVDYGAPVAVSKLVNYFYTPQSKDYRFVDALGGPLQWVSANIYRSSDKVNWTLADSFTNQPADFPQILGISQPQAFRYYKIEVTGVNSAYFGCRTYEIETYTGPVICKTETLTSPARTADAIQLRITVSGASSYAGMTASVLPGSYYSILSNDVAVNAQGQTTVQIKATRPGRIPIALQLKSSGQVIDSLTAYVSVTPRITITNATINSPGVHGTAVNNGSVAVPVTVSWNGTAVTLGTLAAGASQAFDLAGTPSSAGVDFADITIDESGSASYIHRLSYALSSLPLSGTLNASGLTTVWSLAGSNLSFGITPAGSTNAINSILSVKLDGAYVTFQPAPSTSGSLVFRAAVSAGTLEMQIVPENASLKTTFNITRSGIDSGTRIENQVDVILTTPTATFRLIPGWIYGTDSVPYFTKGADYLPTRMSAVQQASGTLALVPSSDRCDVGMSNDAPTVSQKFQNAPITMRIAASKGDWFDVFKNVVGNIEAFSDPLQYRPLIETISGEMRYLTEDASVWSSAYGALRSFPNADYFFNFYGAPYAVPALYTRYLTTGDAAALQRATSHINWLKNSAIRSTNPATLGAFYSSWIDGLGPRDQAHNVWLEPHSSGAGAWALLYYYNASGRTDASVLSSARTALDWLISIQRPSGGWVYAYLPNGTAVTDQEDSGNIWNIWALYRMYKYTGEQKYLDAANRAKTWFAATWVPKCVGKGYWEDGSGLNGVVNMTQEAYEFAIATQAFAEMGDNALVVDCAKISMTWVWTRTIDSRDYFNSYGHVHEQFGWPPGTYVTPMFAMAAQAAYRITGDSFYAPLAGISKTISWWIDTTTGAGFWPGEGTLFVPLDGPLNTSSWVDWITAQQASISYKWLVDEVNRRCPGKINVDNETMKGTVLDGPGNVYLRTTDVTVTGTFRNQFNWVGYKKAAGYALCIMNHGGLTDVDVSVNLSSLGMTGALANVMTSSDGVNWTTTAINTPASFKVYVPAIGTAIVSWQLTFASIASIKKSSVGTRGQINGVVTRWLGANPTFVIEAENRSGGILVWDQSWPGGANLFIPGDTVSLVGSLIYSGDMPLLQLEQPPIKTGHITPLTTLGTTLANLENKGLAMNGMLVRVTGKVVSRDPTGNPSFRIDDGTTSPVTVYTWGMITLPPVDSFVSMNAIGCRLNGAPYLDVWYSDDITVN